MPLIAIGNSAIVNTDNIAYATRDSLGGLTLYLTAPSVTIPADQSWEPGGTKPFVTSGLVIPVESGKVADQVWEALRCSAIETGV